MVRSVGGSSRSVGHSVIIGLTVSMLLLWSVSPMPVSALDPDEYSIAGIFYGTGWTADSTSGLRRFVALLNLSETYQKHFPDNGTFDAFSQIFILFSIPVNGSEPANGSGLKIRFSYYSAMRCIHLDNRTCPLGSNDTAIGQDIFNLEVRRIIEYRDADGSGAYEPGEPVVNVVPLSQPESPHVRAWPFAQDGSAMDLPYYWNTSMPEAELTEGALFAGDPLLDRLSHFWISTGNGVPTNLTLNSFFFLRPTTYQGVPLTPTRLKLDLLLEHIFYVAGDTAPALEFELTSSQFRFSSNGSGATEGLFTNSTAAQAFFTWNPNATADRATAPVRATIVETNESATVYLSYPRASSIHHDPVFGLAFAGEPRSVPPPGGHSQPPSLEANLWVPFFVALVITVGTGTYLLVRLSRRRPN